MRERRGVEEQSPCVVVSGFDVLCSDRSTFVPHGLDLDLDYLHNKVEVKMQVGEQEKGVRKEDVIFNKTLAN